MAQLFTYSRKRTKHIFILKTCIFSISVSELTKIMLTHEVVMLTCGFILLNVSEQTFKAGETGLLNQLMVLERSTFILISCFLVGFVAIVCRSGEPFVFPFVPRVFPLRTFNLTVCLTCKTISNLRKVHASAIFPLRIVFINYM